MEEATDMSDCRPNDDVTVKTYVVKGLQCRVLAQTKEILNLSGETLIADKF